MAILGITNRTENWKTARYFAPLFGANSVRLARRLLSDEEERSRLQPGEVRLELFWYGMRDHFDKHPMRPEGRRTELARTYFRLFKDLHSEVKGFQGDAGSFKGPEGSYDASKDGGNKLDSNLRNTEVDIVIQSPSHLFIGEAKHESRFGTRGRNFLTHQLIRQYVMACTLVDLRHEDLQVVPFVVGDDRAYLEKTLQVQFMCEQGWMREENILEWSDIEALW